MRYVGIRNNKICLVSETPLQSQSLEIIEVPAELAHLSNSDLLSKCQIKSGKLTCKLACKPAKQLKVAVISNWKQKCGISTYAEKLLPEIIKHVGDFKLFIEEADEPTGDFYSIGNQVVSKDKVSVCWKRGQPTQKLVAAIKEYDPDVVWINHEWGLWHHAGHWLALMSQLSNYRIITTMHSVFFHQDKTICEAAMPEIIVHLDGAKHAMETIKGISGSIYVIPHGCEPYDGKRLWNMYRSEHTIIQVGFLHSYKGWDEALRVVSHLKPKYPDIFFTGLCSESSQGKIEQQLYFNELLKLIDRLDIKDNVSLLKGFQSDQVWDSFFRTNRVALFPYSSHPEHEVFGASGSARVAMSKGLPVVSSTIHHFEDIPSIKATGIEKMADEIDKLFSNSNAYQEQIKKQTDYLNQHTWEKMASRYIEVFEKRYR